MTDDAEAPARKSRKPLFLGLLLAVLGGVGAFGATSGVFATGSDGHSGESSSAAHSGDSATFTTAGNVAFVPLDPIVVSLRGDGSQILRFTSQLEVQPEEAADITALRPRIADVLNGYLQAVEAAELTSPESLLRLRAHMLRRIDLVVGEGRVSDLLVTEFIIN